MQSIKFKSYVGSDGLLQVHLPNIKNTDVEVMVIYQISQPEAVQGADLSQFYGCIQDDSFFRHLQPEQPERETLE
jgi:hypothetical protein